MSLVIRNATVSGQSLRLDPGDTANYITDSTVTGCRVEFRTSGRRVFLLNATFVDCVIVGTAKLGAFQFHGARFEGCRFEGRFRDCDFGARQEPEYGFGSVEDCSFAAARLDRCAFFGESVASIEWPAWPHLVFLEPARNLPDWNGIGFPPEAGLRLPPYDLERWPAAKVLRARVFHLPSQARTLDPALIWPLVKDKPYVTFGGRLAQP